MDSITITIKTNDGEELYNKEITVGHDQKSMMNAISPDFFAEIMDVIASIHIARKKGRPFAETKLELSRQVGGFLKNVAEKRHDNG